MAFKIRISDLIGQETNIEPVEGIETMSNGKLEDQKSQIDYLRMQDFEMIRECNGQKKECRIEIGNQETRMDRLFSKQGTLIPKF